MAYTQAQLDALDAAIAQGALEVQYSDKRVKYRSLAEMLQIRNTMSAVLGTTSTTSGRRYADYSRGV